VTRREQAQTLHGAQTPQDGAAEARRAAVIYGLLAVLWISLALYLEIKGRVKL
jgi:hypothetical protein